MHLSITKRLCAFNGPQAVATRIQSSYYGDTQKDPNFRNISCDTVHGEPGLPFHNTAVQPDEASLIDFGMPAWHAGLRIHDGVIAKQKILFRSLLVVYRVLIISL